MNTLGGEEGPRCGCPCFKCRIPLPRGARQALPCPASVSGEQRVEGEGGVPGLSGLWPCGGKVRASESLLAGS